MFCAFSCHAYGSNYAPPPRRGAGSARGSAGSGAPSLSEAPHPNPTALEPILALVKDYRRSPPNSPAGVVVGQYGCPRSLGNTIHEFLNSLAAAVVSGREFRWEYNTANWYKRSSPQSECDTLLQRAPWMRPALVHNATTLQLGQDDIGRRLACAGVDDAERWPVLRLATEMPGQWAAALAARGARLHDDASRLRASRLFSMGADLAYGLLLSVRSPFEPPRGPIHNPPVPV